MPAMQKVAGRTQLELSYSQSIALFRVDDRPFSRPGRKHVVHIIDHNREGLSVPVSNSALLLGIDHVGNQEKDGGGVRANRGPSVSWRS